VLSPVEQLHVHQNILRPLGVHIQRVPDAEAVEVRPEAVGEVRRERLGRGGVPEAAQHVVVDAQPGALAPRALLRLRVDPASLHRRAREVLGEMPCCSGVSDSLSPSLVFIILLVLRK